VRKAAGILLQLRMRCMIQERCFRTLSASTQKQAAEKNLKAYLVFLKEEFPKTHALEDLVLIASSHDPLSRNLFTMASDLSPYAVEIRYPETPSPSPEDAREAVHAAEMIRDYVLDKILLKE
jgi:HEPN domain-containing protein